MTAVSADSGVTARSGVAAGPDIGRGWFPADAEKHRRDAPKYCPACAAPLSLAHGGQGLTTEYWAGADRVFVCFCGATRRPADGLSRGHEHRHTAVGP